MKDGIFTLDGLEGRYPGQYEEGVFWNGWYCPRFTVEVCRKILEEIAHVENTEEVDEERCVVEGIREWTSDSHQFRYEIKEDEIVVWREPMDYDDIPERYPIDSGGFCHLGGWFWIWDQEGEEEEW
jgi:hypothetical protein